MTMQKNYINYIAPSLLITIVYQVNVFGNNLLFEFTLIPQAMANRNLIINDIASAIQSLNTTINLRKLCKQTVITV